MVFMAKKRGPKIKQYDIAPYLEFTPAQIKGIIKKAGFTQKQFCQVVGLSLPVIQQACEKSSYKPPKTLRRWLEILDTNPQFFEEYGIADRILTEDEELDLLDAE